MQSGDDSALQVARGVAAVTRESRLLDGSWDPLARRLMLHIDCLRRNVDGSPLSDTSVELHMAGVVAIAVAYDPKWPEERPSELRLAPERVLASLQPWPLDPQELVLHVNSVADQEQLDMAARVGWILGDSEHGRAAPMRVSFNFDWGPAAGMLWIASDALASFAAGRALGIDTWIDQFDAWWRDWVARAPARRRAEPKDSAKLRNSERAARCGASGDPPFILESTTAPDELLRPIRVWFEAPLVDGWIELARVYPHLDSTERDRAETLERYFEDAKTWSFAREIEAWWIEGKRAYVRVLGVAYFPPDDGERARARLSAWSFELRRRSEGWQIRSYVEGDAPDGARRAPWVARWPAGAVRDALDVESTTSSG